MARCRNDPQLLQQAELVNHTPMFHNLPVEHAHDIDNVDAHGLTRRWDILERTQIGSVEGFAGDYLVPFGDLIIQFHPQIRKRVPVQSEKELLHPLSARWKASRCGVVNDIRSQQFLEDSDVCLANELVIKAADEYLIFVS